jgi:hypothetical protein
MERKMKRTIIRYEYDEDTIRAVCENEDGERFYIDIMINGEITF